MFKVEIDADDGRDVTINELTEDDAHELRQAVESLNLLKAYHGASLSLSVGDEGRLKARLTMQ